MEVEGGRKAPPKTTVMGTSVLGIKYKDGVMLASDTQASFGSYAKFKHVQRVFSLSPNILLASSGEYSNVQVLKHLLECEIEQGSEELGEENAFGPRECFEVVKAHMYKKRSSGAPEMNSHIIAGIEKRKNQRPEDELPYEVDESGRFLGTVNQLGNFFQASVAATGLGAHIALPILRNRVEGRENSITKEEAEAILKDCMRVLVYRDTRASEYVQLATVTASEVHISDPFKIDTHWGIGA